MRKGLAGLISVVNQLCAPPRLTWRCLNRLHSTGSPRPALGDVGGDLLERLATTDRLHGDPGIELGAMVAEFAKGWEPFYKGHASLDS